MSTASRRLVPLIAAVALSAPRAVASAAPAGPVWEASLGASAGFDSNVYLAEFGPLANRESAFGAVSARVGTKLGSGLAFSYSVISTKFSEQPDEDNIKQSLAASWARKLDALAWNASTEFALVDGDDRAVDYGSGVGSAFSTAVPRERRDQFQNKTDLALRHDAAPAFVRAVGKLQYWDMRTAAVSACNYVDRHDTQGGVDLGRVLAAGKSEAYLGYRRGYQFQDNDFAPATVANASNHYDRHLAGFDGSPVKSLKINAQAGWEKHRYNADYADSPHEEGLFVDASLTWSPGPDDELQFKTSQARGFSTTGKNSVLLSSHQLAWKHAFNTVWTTTLAGRVSEAEYAPYRRDDLAYASTASLTWNATRSLSCTLTVSQDWGRNNLNGLTGLAEEKREFDRTSVSVGVNWKL